MRVRGGRDEGVGVVFWMMGSLVEVVDVEGETGVKSGVEDGMLVWTSSGEVEIEVCEGVGVAVLSEWTVEVVVGLG